MPARASTLRPADRWQRHPGEDPGRLPDVLRFVDDALLLVNVYGGVQDLNAAAERLLALTAAEASGRLVQEICPLADVLTGVRQHPLTADAVATGRAVSSDTELCLCAGADVVEVDAAAVPVLLPDGTMAGALLTLRSLSDRRRLEQAAREAAQARECLGRTVATAMHDLTNALAPVTLVVSGFREDGIADVAQLDTIINSLERAIDTVRELRVSVSARGTARPDVALAGFLQGVEAAVRQSLPAPVELRVLDAEPGQVAAFDAMSLHGVMLRLAQRARDAMAGHGRLTLAASCSDGRLTITIQDTGASLEARPLQGVEVSWPAPAAETGGAAVVRSLLGEALPPGSLARIDSVVGRGTRIAVEVPVQAGAAPAASSHARTDFDGRGRLVLCVDDEPAVRDALATTLARLNLTPAVAPDAIYALQLAREYGARIAAVVTDVNMPDMEGLQLAHELAGILPGVPVVLSTGLVDDRVRAAVATARVASLLEKPFTKQSLAACLATVMDRGGSHPAPRNASEEESYR